MKYTQRITNYIQKYTGKKKIVKHSSTSTLNTLNLWRPVLGIAKPYKLREFVQKQQTLNTTCKNLKKDS